jgi:hypothetical protein
MMNISKLIKTPASIKRHGFLTGCKIIAIKLCVRSLNSVHNSIVRFRDFKSGYTFVDHRKDAKKLIVILAGHKQYLWPTTLLRVKKYAPPDHDLCVASPGLYLEELSKFCADSGFSYLSTKKNAPGIALNIAVDLHKSAELIYKLDEDIFIGKHFFDDISKGYRHFFDETGLEPGFCTPILNINGITSVDFLQAIGKIQAYSDAFSTPVRRCGGVSAHSNPDACLWLWEHSLPFDKMADDFHERNLSTTVCATRFSIGAILFHRSFWEQCKGFASSWIPGELGVDEDNFCKSCVSLSRPMVIVQNVLCGHFSFYPQESFMKTKIPHLSATDPLCFPPEMLRISEDNLK